MGLESPKYFINHIKSSLTYVPHPVYITQRALKLLIQYSFCIIIKTHILNPVRILYGTLRENPEALFSGDTILRSHTLQ